MVQMKSEWGEEYKKSGKHATGYYVCLVCVFRVRVVRVTGPREARQFGRRECLDPNSGGEKEFLLWTLLIFISLSLCDSLDLLTLKRHTHFTESTGQI